MSGQEPNNNNKASIAKHSYPPSFTSNRMEAYRSCFKEAGFGQDKLCTKGEEILKLVKELYAKALDVYATLVMQYSENKPKGKIDREGALQFLQERCKVKATVSSFDEYCRFQIQLSSFMIEFTNPNKGG